MIEKTWSTGTNRQQKLFVKTLVELITSIPKGMSKAIYYNQ